MLRRVIAAVLEHALAGEAEGERERALASAACRVVRAVKRAPLAEPLRALLQHGPRARLPALLAHAVREVSEGPC